MIIKNKTSRLAIILGVFIIILGVSWFSLFFLIRQDRRVVMENSKNSRQSANRGSDTLALDKEKIDSLNKYFLTSETVVVFVEELEKLGQQTGVKLVIGQAEDKVTELKLNLSTEGTFSQTMKFLQSLENLPYASKIERLELRKREMLWQSVFILRVLKDKK